MRANLPAAASPSGVAAWASGRLYERYLQAQRADAPLFLLHDGPP
jgi:isoleucyl-tRNA synthetase